MKQLSTCPQVTLQLESLTMYLPGAGCEITSSFTILDAQATVEIDAADLILTENVNCADPFTGIADVQQVLEDGLPQSPAGYTYEWLEPDGVYTHCHRFRIEPFAESRPRQLLCQSYKQCNWL